MSNTRKPRNIAAMNGTQSGETTDAGSGAPAAEPLAFEEALGRLDETVAALEGGQLPLEDALRLYEEGVRMARRCQEMLDTAELRVQRLRIDTDSEDSAGSEDDQPSGSVFVLEAFEVDDE